KKNSNPRSPVRVSTDKGLDIRKVTSRLPLRFEPNLGRSSEKVKFILRGNGYGLFLTASEAVFVLPKNERVSEKKEPLNDDLSVSDSSLRSRNSASARVLTLRLLGANKHSQVRGLDELPGRQNYFIGNDPKQWRTDVPAYRKVSYEEIYDGINLTYYGNQRQLEYDFEVAPGADPKTIRLSFDSGTRARISSNGDLVLTNGAAEVRQQKPIVYQQVNGDRRLIEGQYVLLG